MSKDQKIPPATISDAPEHQLEKKLRERPGDADTKVDVGSDESMDASDPPATSTPGSDKDPVPSSGFPE